MASSSPCSCALKYLIALVLVFSMYFQNVKNCNAFQTFGFEMHHRFSDQVKSIMGGDNLPEIGSLEYYAAMIHRDKVFHGRALAENGDDDSKLLAIETSKIASLGTLHYADVSLGTPSVSFLVALDTGTNLLWVPCDCANCARNIKTSTPGVDMNLNIYNINSSSTSKYVSCNSSLCESQKGCSKSSSQCPYQVAYNANITSSGILVEDVLRLKTNNKKPKDIGARITFGCGQVQTGLYLEGFARNGLFGLGIGNKSVPSILSRQGLVADSFSMCFGSDGAGRIIFGDKGSSDQEETPFNIRPERPRYNISVTQLSVGGKSGKLDFSAIVYSGSQFTFLSEPAYTALCDSFDSQTLLKRSSATNLDYEYCYDVSLDSTELSVPSVTLIMEGGSKFNVHNPMVPVISNEMVTGYCLGVIKTASGNFIGNNFLTGHHIVFDREKMVLGWKASNCTDGIPPKASPAPSTDVIPPTASPPSTPPTALPPTSTDGIPPTASPPSTDETPAASPPSTGETPPATSPPSTNEIPPTASPPTINVPPPHSINDGTPKNGSNSKAPQFSVGKPQILYLIASSLLVLFLATLQIV